MSQTDPDPQLTIARLQRELATVSGHLAGAYDELALVHATSDAARLARRPADFFRQTCLDTQATLNCRAVGVVTAAAPVLYGNLRIPAHKLTRLATQLLGDFSGGGGGDAASPVILPAVGGSPFAYLAPHAGQLLAVPIHREAKQFGCLFALDKHGSAFTAGDARLLTTIANQSAVFLENLELFDDVRDLVLGLLRSLTSAIDAKDPYTRGHSARVAKLAQAVAQSAGLSAGEAHRVYLAGLLHDVGKIGVPEAILHKPTALTADEFEQIKAHPQIGARILKDIPQVADLIPAVLHHHERYDGAGYPHGLAGSGIPVAARILTLADSLDAMTSPRNYRQALPLDRALEEIDRCRGSHFDPQFAGHLVGLARPRLQTLLAA